ncbi:MAG: hypothetical protein V4648_05920 [Bacteroidota bacterium]
MKKIAARLSVWTTLLFLCVYTSNAQVGIGTTTPHDSSLLDVTSTTKGFLTPRMTTAQRVAIALPADGLLVYDTSLKSFYYYNTTTATWLAISSEVNGRLKFKRIKSTDVLATVLADEKAVGSNAKYVLDTSTLYEINGTINVDLPIDLNNAYIAGLDANQDKLVRTSGNLFDGATGGGVRNLTIQVTGGGSVFNLIGAATQSLIFRDTVVTSCSNVGTINGFGLVFFAIIQYVGNTNGITYTNITRLLLSNTAWFGNNAGTFEKLTGTFSLVEKQGGFCEVNGTAIGFDVSGNPTISGDAVMETVVFAGTLSSGLFIKGYTVGNYTGYNFNNKWNVRCAGIPTESDATATGNLYKTSSTTTTTTTATTQNTGYKVNTTASSALNLLRFASATTARLTYKGTKSRAFQASASISFIESSGGTNANYVFYFVKIAADGTTVTPLPETETFIDTNSGFVQAFPITGTVVLLENESVEVYLKRVNTGTKIAVQTYSYNLSLK